MRTTLSCLIVVCSLFFAVPADALEVGVTAPPIDLVDLDGNLVSAESLRGKVVIVDFWATWCDPCRDELPVLERLYQRYRDQGLVIVAVSVDREVGNVRRFAARNPISFPIVHDAIHQVAQRYRPPRMPSSYVIGRDGVVRHVHVGFEDADAARFETEVQALLGQPAPEASAPTPVPVPVPVPAPNPE